MQCPNCNNLLQPNARFCAICGQSIDTGAPAARAAAVPASLAADPFAGGMGSAASAASVGPSSLSALFQRMKNILLIPKSEWPVIAPEPTSIAQLYTGYVIPLAAFAALMSLVRMALIGVNVPFGGVVRTPIASALGYAIVTFGIGQVFLFLVGLLINALAPSFSGFRDQRQAVKVAAYSFTPAWLSAMLALSPVLPTVLQLLAGLYGIYVLYLGLPILMRAPRDKAFGYTAAVVICTIVLGILLGVLGAAAGHFGRTDAMRFGRADDNASRDRHAAAVGNIIGNALGTDEKGKADLTAALSNLAKAAQQREQPSAATGNDAPVHDEGAAARSDPPATAGGSAPSALSAAGGMLTAMGGALGGTHRVAAVDFKSLTAMLPSALPGMKRTDVHGEAQGAVGVKTTSASANYQGDKTSVRIEISDLSGLSGLMDIAGALVQNTTSESDTGFERDQIIDGRSVHEKYDTQAKKGELSIMLAKRFQVNVTGDGVAMGALEQSLGQVDLARLESMKDEGSAPK